MSGVPWEAILRSIRHYFRLQVFGVMMPGLLLLMEFGYWTLPSSARQDLPSVLSFISLRAHRLDGWILALTGTLALVAAYGLGFVIRQLIWSVVLRRAREVSWPDLLAELAANYNADSMETILRRHPALLKPEGITGAGIRRYAKLWLQQRNPELAVDYLESEINVAFATTVPAAIAPFVLFQWIFSNSLLYFCAAALVGIGSASLLLVSGLRLRNDTEPYETVFSFFMAHWISQEEHGAPRGGRTV